MELSDGNIYIDGENLEAIDTSQMIHTVNQQEHIFTSDYKNNVTVFGVFPFKKISLLESALDKSILKSIAEKTNCQLLSGGEKQVLALFRMFLANPSICLMYEVFSATDMNITQKLQKILFLQSNIKGELIK